MHYTLTQQIPSEVQKDAYETFIRFLRGVTEQELFLPTEHLSRYPHRQCCLLLSPSRVRELFEVYNPSLRYSQRLVNYRGYNLIVDKGSQLSDTEAYLIAPSKYTLFLRQVHDGNEIKIYRSNFVDLTGNTPPPLDLYAQDVIDTVRNETGAEIESEPRYRQLFMFPQLHRKEPPVTVTECPECGGKVQRVGGGSYFCLDCNWDNLPTLR